MVNQINDHHFSDKKAKEVCQGFLVERPQLALECPLLWRVSFSYISSSQRVSPRAVGSCYKFKLLDPTLPTSPQNLDVVPSKVKSLGVANAC